MTKILGIYGSLRRGSYNAALLRAAAGLVEPDVTVEIASIHGIPLYDADVDAAGTPPAVAQLKERIVATDALLLATPEYNNSLPGVFKNAMDWVSRPASDIPRVFGGRKVAFMGASTTRFGTVLSQTAWLPVVRALGMQPWFGTLLHVPLANTVFDASGELTDPALRERLSTFMRKFVEFVRA